jgi:hypothetical protein
MPQVDVQKSTDTWASALGYAGVLPVAGLLLAAWINPAWQQPSMAFASSYAALILSFIGGIHWGFATSGIGSAKTFAISVIPSLWAWAALAYPAAYTLSALIIGLIVFLIYERNSELAHHFPSWYLPLRLRLTIGLSLGLGGFFLFAVL